MVNGVLGKVVIITKQSLAKLKEIAGEMSV